MWREIDRHAHRERGTVSTVCCVVRGRQTDNQRERERDELLYNNVLTLDGSEPRQSESVEREREKDKEALGQHGRLLIAQIRFRVQGSGFRVQGSGFQGSGCRVQGSGCSSPRSGYQLITQIRLCVYRL